MARQKKSPKLRPKKARLKSRPPNLPTEEAAEDKKS